MLREVKKTSQVPGKRLRRWFSDSELDLIVWEDDDGNISKFQLCYGKGKDEQAFTWRNSGSYTHDRIDDGEDVVLGHKNSPILVPDGKFSPAALVQIFIARSHNVDSKISEFICEKLLNCRK